MGATTVETTVGTAGIFPVVTLVPANGGADYDLRGTAPDIDALVSAVEGVSGAISLGVKTKYKMNRDGFEIKPIEGALDNRKNPHLLYEAKAVVPAPDASGTTIQTKRDALMAVTEGDLYDAYFYDPYSQADAWTAKMTNVKVKALPEMSPDGELFMVTISTQNHGSYDPVWLPQTAPE